VKQKRLWVIHRTDTPTWTYQSKKPNGNCGWLALADLMREEMRPRPIKSVVYDSLEAAEAVVIGLGLQHEDYKLSVRAAFGVLMRWAVGPTNTASTGKWASMRLPRSRRNG
jgi:hypothetical protein